MEIIESLNGVITRACKEIEMGKIAEIVGSNRDNTKDRSSKESRHVRGTINLRLKIVKIVELKDSGNNTNSAYGRK